MKKESLSTSMAKLIMVMSLMVGIGAVMGMVGFLGTMFKTEIRIDNGTEAEILQIKTELAEYNSANKSLFEWENYSIKFPNDWSHQEERVVSSRKTGALKTVFNDKNTQAELLSIVAGGDRPDNLLDEDLPEIEIANYTFEKFDSSQIDNNQVYYIYKTGTDDEINNGMEAEIIFEFNNVDEGRINGILGSFSLQLLDETADWKTYRNEEYGFEVKYPENWRAHLNSFRGAPNMVFCSPDFFEEKNNGWMSWVDDLEIKGCASNRRIWEGDYGTDKITIEGIEGVFSEDEYNKSWKEKVNRPISSIYLFVSKDKEVYPSESSYVSLEDNYFGNWYLVESGDDIENSKVFDQILSSFKFVEKDEMKILSPTKGEIWKTGEGYNILWTPRSEKNSIDIRLYNNDAPDMATRLVWQPSNVPNTGKFEFDVSDELKNGNRYQFTITEYSNDGTFNIESDEFSIVNK